MSKQRSRRLSYKAITGNWEDIVLLLCDEKTPYDILNLISNYLDEVIQQCKENGIGYERFEKAKEKISQACVHLNPEVS